MSIFRDNGGMTEAYDWVDDPEVPFKALLNYVESLPEVVVAEPQGESD